MVTFWLATIGFVALGFTPLAVATLLNRRDRRSAGRAEESTWN
ncbi:hypothetical protein EV191_102179 [Tamaricihabitans halophyticus]|uniref:Uncharacterized protein n=1 Tax=Tamaricihabitans halophyticus TaxID=1262583 RepID=A0A4R2R0J7_9PSEU|nr:hypothetical protein [Tamaricihabitans halophyticus]TCP54968.1 hypothetical protein EV191_102179 [Tamaricihabitans halophyticus]